MSSSLQQNMERKLKHAFAPEHLMVINESHLHAGHKRDDGGTYGAQGESHFRIIIGCQTLNSMSRVEAHRAVMAVLQQELAGPLHAVAIELLRPSSSEGEQQAKS